MIQFAETFSIEFAENSSRHIASGSFSNILATSSPIFSDSTHDQPPTSSGPNLRTTTHCPSSPTFQPCHSSPPKLADSKWFACRIPIAISTAPRRGYLAFHVLQLCFVCFALGLLSTDGSCRLRRGTAGSGGGHDCACFCLARTAGSDGRKR